jgi:hypothetical protein
MHPKTLDDMKAANWTFKNYGTCSGCGADVEWYVTDRGSPIPLDPMPRGSSPVIPHRQTCTNFPTRN